MPAQMMCGCTSPWMPACAGMTRSVVVIPAKAGIQNGGALTSMIYGYASPWMPACRAGMTGLLTPASARPGG